MVCFVFNYGDDLRSLATICEVLRHSFHQCLEEREAEHNMESKGANVIDKGRYKGRGFSQGYE